MLVTSSRVTTPVKVAATPVTFLTEISGVPSRAYAVVAKETEVPAATDPKLADPVTVYLPPTLKFPGALSIVAALNALYATASITSPFSAPPFNIEKFDPSVEV